MKRVFAFISLFAISLVMFGFGTANVKAADEPAEGKWVVNPYLLEDENGLYFEYGVDAAHININDFEEVKD